jgi:arylformamidase
MLYDITVPIHSGMPGYEGDPPVRITPHLSVTRGDPVNVSALTLGSHAGTHVDAPRHLQERGAGVDALSLAVLVGPARVVDCTGAPRITPAQLDPETLGTGRLLFKTRQRPADPAGSLTAEAALQCIRAGVRLVGVDGLSVDAADTQQFPVHRLLLEAGLVIVEGLDLSGVPAGAYELLCLPLKLQDGDGAPARVLLRT